VVCLCLSSGCGVRRLVVAGADANVVLEGEPRPREHLEARALAAQVPQHLAVRVIHLVGRPDVAARDQEISVLIEVDRGDVEVVIRLTRVLRRQVLVAVGERNVVEAVPTGTGPRRSRCQSPGTIRVGTICRFDPWMEVASTYIG